jgi:hypothetical protein
MQDHEAENYFPGLYLPELKRYAQLWAGRYRSIQRVCLYTYVPDYLEVYKGLYSNSDLRYAIVFELRPDIEPDALSELELVTKRREGAQSRCPVLLERQFFSPYNSNQGFDWPDEWIIHLRKTGEEAPPGVLDNHPFWVLHDSDAYLFPDLDRATLEEYVRRWAGEQPSIRGVALYEGKDRKAPYVLVILTDNKADLDSLGLWQNSLALLKSYKDPGGFRFRDWRMMVLDTDEDTPIKAVRLESVWNLYVRASSARPRNAGKAQPELEHGAKEAENGQTVPVHDETLTGRKDILTYMEKWSAITWPTIKRWAARRNFPLSYTPTNKPTTSKNRIDSWMSKNWLAER